MDNQLMTHTQLIESIGRELATKNDHEVRTLKKKGIECFKLLEQANSIIKSQYKKGVMLLGGSGAGKTTLLYHLNQHRLQVYKQKQDLKLRPFEVINKAEVGSNPTKSTTTLPNIFENVSNSCYLVDFPGFEDTNSIKRIVNSFYIMKTMKNFTEACFVYVTTTQDLFNGSKSFLDCLQIFLAIFNSDKICDLIKCIALCVTKSPNQNHEQEFDILKEKIQQFYFPGMQDSVAKTVLREILENKRVIFFNRPAANAEFLEQNTTLETLLQSTEYWKVDKNIVNYHSLTEESTIRMAKYFLKFALEQLDVLTELIASTLDCIIDKRDQINPEYAFIQKWQQYADLYQGFDNQIEVGKVSKSYFPTYDLIIELQKLEIYLAEPIVYVNVNIALQMMFNLVSAFMSTHPHSRVFKKVNNIVRTNIISQSFLQDLVSIAPADRNRRDLLFGKCSRDAEIFDKVRIDSNQTDLQYYRELKQLAKQFESNKSKDIACICNQKLGDLTKNPKKAALYYTSALKQTQTVHMTYSRICHKIGKLLFSQIMLRQAIIFFKASLSINHIKLCFKHMVKDFGDYVRMADYYISINRFQQASWCFQCGFEVAELEIQKQYAMSRILHLNQNKCMKSELQIFQKLSIHDHVNQFVTQAFQQEQEIAAKSVGTLYQQILLKYR